MKAETARSPAPSSPDRVGAPAAVKRKLAADPPLKTRGVADDDGPPPERKYSSERRGVIGKPVKKKSAQIDENQ